MKRVAGDGLGDICIEPVENLPEREMRVCNRVEVDRFPGRDDPHHAHAAPEGSRPAGDASGRGPGRRCKARNCQPSLRAFSGRRKRSRLPCNKRLPQDRAGGE